MGQAENSALPQEQCRVKTGSVDSCMAARKTDSVEKSLGDMSISAKGGQVSKAGAKKSGDEKDSQVISYSADKVVGNGSFGVVFKATKVDTGEVVAIKKVLQDKRFKNRELQIMRILSHPCIVPLKHCFYSSGDKPDLCGSSSSCTPINT